MRNRLIVSILTLLGSCLIQAKTPNVILVMADDLGWGQTGYYDHPILKTPHLDSMAANGLRMDRFYAAAAVCSPTRASVLTGRTNDRTGVWSHGYGLRQQEQPLPEAMQSAGYSTGHFGKWHLNGIRGPGVPILKDDDYGPRGVGFETWISVTNFFDTNPIMSRGGKFEEFTGDSSEIIVDQALEFASNEAAAGRPFFSVIWYGTPHSPFHASEEDKAGFAQDGSVSLDHYGELVAMDRSIGTLRSGLRKVGVGENTLVWFTSDNGGLNKINPETVGGLRGHKGQFYEGGLRVPCIIEWPAEILPGRTTKYAGCTTDIFATIADVVGLNEETMLSPQDGHSLRPLFKEDLNRKRPHPIGFRMNQLGAYLDYPHKLLTTNREKANYELYDLEADPTESNNLAESHPKLLARLMKEYEKWSTSVDDSVAGLDYPEKEIIPKPPGNQFWRDLPGYAPFLEEWRERPEYESSLSKKNEKKG